jgi:hypothetical protein
VLCQLWTKAVEFAWLITFVAAWTSNRIMYGPAPGWSMLPHQCTFRLRMVPIIGRTAVDVIS